MTNILVDTLVSRIKVGRVWHSIDTDFRNCLKIVLAFEDNELTDDEKQIVLLKNLFYKTPNPNDIGEALTKAVEFLDGNLVTYEQGTQDNVRLFSFSKDATFIFAAFKQTHNIDLNQIKYLHWHKFIAYFMDLGSETTFCQITSFRKRLASGKATKEEREIARELGEIVRVEKVDTRSLEEKEALEKFYKLFEEGKKKRNNV